MLTTARCIEEQIIPAIEQEKKEAAEQKALLWQQETITISVFPFLMLQANLDMGSDMN